MNKLGKRLIGLALAACLSVTVFMGTGVTAFAYTQTTGTVTSDNVKVRESASTTAKQVSSLKNGDKVDIVDESKDASGYVWYKIYVNKSEFGYVRSDLVNKKGGNSSSSSSSTSTQSAASLPETSVTSTEQKSATITTDSANVRKGAGTAYDSVGKVTRGDTVTITGEASGTDGKTWYQVTFGANAKTGFIRSDLLQISEGAAEAPAEGGENVENPEAAEDENAENAEGSQEQSQASTTVTSEQGDGTYSLVYSTDDEGTGIWYLYDNVGGYRVKVKDLIEAAQSAEAVNKLRKTNKNYKMIMIILLILVAALIGGVILLVFKLRDSLYYEDEEEEEYDRYSSNKRPAERDTRRNREEEPVRPIRRASEEERTVRPSRRPAEDEYERPTRRPERAQENVRPSRPVQDEEDMDAPRPTRRPMRDADDRPSRRPVEPIREEAPKREPAPKRKARNFLGEDDDFEFEFLDLDDEK